MLDPQVKGDVGSRAITLAGDLNFNSAEIAARLNGFSGRQISKLCRAWQAAAQASPDFTLTRAMVEEEIASHLRQLQLKATWLKTPTSTA